MSVSSSRSAGSVPSAGGDIIDLDRYMRSAVRPPRTPHRHPHHRVVEQLVVDAGGVGRAPQCTDSDSSLPGRTHCKRFSHDSGLSDGSYVRRRQKTHKRSSEPEQFRVACEKALRDQQQQIARVAQLCERLVPHAQAKPEVPAAPAAPAVPSDSSDVSSTTSTRSSHLRPRRTERHRSDSCKTYKIIMSKLDELGRLLAVRRQSGPAPIPRPRACSSRSVSVCDKLVATEPRGCTVHVTAVPAHQSEQGRKGERSRRLGPSHAQVVLDIAPTPPTTTTVLHCSGAPYEQRGFSYNPTTASVPHACSLDDPLQINEQSKLHATSGGASCPSGPCSPKAQVGPKGDSGSATGSQYPEWVCCVCRGYWRQWRALCRRLPLLFAPRDT